MSAVYGCHNHAPFKPFVEVQAGWTSATMPGALADTRRPHVIRIPFRMSMDCKYDLHYVDPKCKGCSHVAPSQQMEFSFDA